MSKKIKNQRSLSDEYNDIMGDKQDDLNPQKTGDSYQTSTKKPENVDESAFQPLIPQMKKNQSQKLNDQQDLTSITDNQYLRNWQAVGQNKVANMSYKNKKNYTELTDIQKKQYDMQLIQEEKIKSDLKEIQIQLDQIEDKNSEEYKNILKYALQQLIQLIKMQPDRILSKTNTSKKLFTINEEDEFLKDGVEIEWIKDKGSSSLLRSKKGLLSNVYNIGEKYAKQGLNLVEEALLNQIDARDLALKKEEERQDDIWQKIIQRTCRTQAILNEHGVNKPSIQQMKYTTNCQLLVKPESYYDSLEKESVSFELHQYMGYFYIAEIISYVCLNCRFYLINKYSLDLGDNEFKPSGCFAIQTPLKQKFSSLSILMRGKVTYFFNHERNGNQKVLQMYKHSEDNKLGIIEKIADNYIQLQSENEFKYEFMIDLSIYEKVKMKESDFLQCQYIQVTQQDQGTDDAGAPQQIIKIKVYNFCYGNDPMLEKEKPSVEGKDDSVGFFKEISDKETRFFFYFKNKFQMYVDYDQRNPTEQLSGSDTFRYQDEAQFLNCHFKRWQAQAFRSENIERKIQDVDQTVEIIYFLFLDNKDNLSYVQLWSQPQDKKMKKQMEKFMHKIIQERNKAKDLINRRVGEKLQGYSYFLLNNHKVIAYNEDQVSMLYLKDFSKAKNNVDFHEPSFNNIYLYQASQENKLAYYSQQYAFENANICENKSLFLHKTKQRVIYSCHMIFINSYEDPKNTKPVLKISKEWMFMDTKGDGNLSIIYLGDQQHAEPDNKYFCYWYHISSIAKFATLFLKRGLEMSFLQMNINQLEKSSLSNICKPLFHDQMQTEIPEDLSDDKKIKAIQFEHVTDPTRLEDDYITFIAYLQNENDNKSNILGTPQYCRAQISRLRQTGGIDYVEIPLDIGFLNKFSPNRKQSQTLLFARCSPLFKQSRTITEQSFQIGFSHYDEKKFQDCIEIYEYKAVMKQPQIELNVKKAYLIVGHKKMHQDEDQQGNCLQRQFLVPIIDSNGEPSANQLVFQGKKFENKRLEEDEDSYGEYDDEDEYGNEDDEGHEDEEANRENEYGAEENEGGTSEHAQINYILPLDQDNCNRYRTKIINASYKHFGLKSRALFTVIATEIQKPLLKKEAFTEQEKLYLLNQSICNLLTMSEPTFGELFGEIYQQLDNHIQQIFQLRFIKKGFNNFATNLKNKTFDQSDLNQIFKQLQTYDFNKQKTFVPSNSIIERSLKSLHLVGLYNVNILFDLQAGFSHQSLIEWGFDCANFPALVEIVKTIIKQKFHNLNRKMLLMCDLPQLMSDPKISMRNFLHRDMTPLPGEDEEKSVCLADLLEDIELPSISDKNREYFEVESTGFDDQKAEILPIVLNTLNKGDLNEAEEVNFIIIDFFTTTLKLKIDVIKNRQANNSTDYLKFFRGKPYNSVNCNEIFIAGLICQRTDQDIFNYNIIQKIIERQELKFAMLGTKYLWFFYTLGFYAPYAVTICLRHTYRNDFKGYGVAQYEGGKEALLAIYIMRGVAGFTQIFYWFLEFEEMSFSGMSYFESPSNIADFTNPILYAAHLALSTIILEKSTQEYGTLDTINSYIEFLLIVVSSVKFLNLMKSFSDYQMLVEMLFQVIRQIIPLLVLFIFSLAAISFCQMVALSEYRLDWEDGKPYPIEYPLQPRVGFMFLQTLRNSMGDTKTPMGGVWQKLDWSLCQSFAFGLQWLIYIIAIFLINIIILNFLIIWVGEIYAQVKGGIPYYFQMQAEMNFNYLKSTRHIMRSQNKYNQIWIIKSPLNGLPDSISANELEGLYENIAKMQNNIKNKLYKKLEGQQKQLEQNVEKVKNDLNTRLQDIEKTQYEILDLLKKQKK